jgi:hypothetical protein
LAFVLACLPNTYAGASNKNGNPFGNGTFFQTTGTFSAVIRGQNLSGTMLFSTGASTNGGTNSSGGSCVISYLGAKGTNSDGTEYEDAPGVYNGNAAGMWDPSSGSISGQFWGGYNLSGTNSATIYPDIYVTPVPTVEVISNQILQTTFQDPVTGVTTFYTTNVVLTNFIYITPIGSNVFKNSVFMNGTFDGSIQNKYPNQTFSAQGMISQQQLNPPPQGSEDQKAGTIPVEMAKTKRIDVTVQGLRVSDTYTSFNAVSNAIPYTITTYSITNVTSLQGQ